MNPCTLNRADQVASASLRQGYRPGIIGRVTELHADYYQRHAGFGCAFEAKVARELAEFCSRFDAARDGLWYAEIAGQVEASIVIDAIHAEHDGAHLRWFIASERSRGRGIGTTLLARAVAHCRALNYHRVYLWTFEGLPAARHLYEKSGFRLVHAARGLQWGTEVVEQRFELPLASSCS